MSSHGGTAQKVLDALAAHGLKKQGNEWRANSPLRPGSNSHAFTLTLDDDEHGAWHDHVSAESGSLYDLAGRLGIETPKAERVEVVSSKRGYTDMADYARAHGVPVEALKAAGWSETIHNGRPALLFPTLTGKRVRFIDGKSPAYMHEKAGYKKCWYGLKRAIEIAQREALPLVICNGEISTVAAQYFGVPACAVTSGEGAIPPDLLAELTSAWQEDIVIALDCDDTGRRAAAAMAAQLPEAQIVDLGFTSGGDLADFAKLYEQGAVAELLKLRQGAAAPAPANMTSTVGAGAVPSSMEELRQLQDVALLFQRLARQADPDAAAKLLAQMQRNLDKLGSQGRAVSLRAGDEIAVRGYSEIIARRAEPNRMLGIPTGLAEVDAALNGLRAGRLILIYAATNMGKSTVAASIAATLLVQQPGIVCTTEMSTERWMAKVAARMTTIPTHRIEAGAVTDEEMRKLDAAYSRIADAGVLWNDTSAPSVSALSAAFEKAFRGSRPPKWILIDSGSRITAAGLERGEAQIAAASECLVWAQTLKVPVIVTVQTGRNSKDRANKAPGLNDATYTSEWENNADAVLGLYRHDYYVQKGECEADDTRYPSNSIQISLLKNRDGDASGNWSYGWLGGVGVFPLRREPLSSGAR